MGVFYRPPNSKTEVIYELNKSMSLISNNGKKLRNVILTGDFNLPNLNWVDGYNVSSESSELTQSFMSVIENNFLYQHVCQPTRITEKTSNILDLLFTSHPSLVSKVNIIPGISDHEAISFTICCMSKDELKNKHIYFYSKANFEQFRKDLAEVPLSDKSNIEQYWQLLKYNVKKICDVNVPHGNLRKGSNVPWVNKELRKLMKKRNRIFKKAKKTSKVTQWDKYRQLRREVKKKIRSSYVHYLQNDICNSLKHNPKLFWNFIKSRKCDRGTIECLNVNGTIITEDQQKADAFNVQFNQVFRDRANLPQSEFNSNVPTMEDIQCTEAEVLKLLKNIDASKAQGPDEIAPRLLKEGSEQLAPTLCKLFNLSLSSGILPIDWRRANICPLHKKGNKQDPSNYRPISLTSVTCKVLERIVCKRLIEHFNENNILCDSQHGFREKRSCETQLIEAITD